MGAVNSHGIGGKLVRWAIFGGIVIALISILRPEATQPANSPTISAQPEAAKDKLTPAWTYGNFVDQMSGEKKERWANLEADNLLDLKFPYNGGVTLTMTVYQDEYGPIARLSLSKGMFDEGQPRVKFNDGKVMNISDVGEWDMSDDPTKRSSIRFREISYGKKPKQDFFALLKKSKHLKIEAHVYDNGPKIIEFSTAGLDPTIFADIKKHK